VYGTLLALVTCFNCLMPMPGIDSTVPAELLDKLLSRDPIVVEEAVVALCKLDAAPVCDSVRKMILRDQKLPQLPAIVCDLIGKLGTEQDLDLLRMWIQGNESQLRISATRALVEIAKRHPKSESIDQMLETCGAKLKIPGAFPALVRPNTTKSQRSSALRKLRSKNALEIVDAIDFLKADHVTSHQKELSRTWKRIPKSGGHQVRIAIVQALAEIPIEDWQSSTREIMTSALENRDWRVRRRAVEALLEIWKPISIDLLLDTLPEEIGNPDLFDWHHALSDLTGEKKPVDPRAWTNFAQMYPSPRNTVVKGERAPGGWLRAPAEGVGNAAAKDGPTIVFFDLPVLAADAVFLFDLSGSMNGDFGGRTRLEAARIEIDTMLEKWITLPRSEQPRFNLVLFREPYDDPWNATIERVFPRLAPISPQNAQIATQWFARQGTCRFAYLESIEAALEDPECRFIYFLSDGEPWGGRCNDLDRLLLELERLTRFHPVAIHNVVIGGSELAEEYCEKISGRHSGRLRIIGNASETLPQVGQAGKVFSATRLGTNIIINPGAEADQVTAGSGKIARAGIISAWESADSDTPVMVQPWNGYALDEGDHLPVPDGAGKNYFLHGTIGDVSMRTTLRQVIELKKLRRAIDKGSRYNLSAWLGGWKQQGDQAQVSITFYDEEDTALASDTLGPIQASHRGNKNGMIRCESENPIPQGSRKVIVELIFDKEKGGSVSDAAIDCLRLVIDKNSQ